MQLGVTHNTPLMCRVGGREGGNFIILAAFSCITGNPHPLIEPVIPLIHQKNAYQEIHGLRNERTKKQDNRVHNNKKINCRCERGKGDKRSLALLLPYASP